MQNELFTDPLTDAHAKGSEAAEAAAEHAGDYWKEAAMRSVLAFANAHRGEMHLAEDIRTVAEFVHKIGDPPDKRAWGHIMQQAKRLGIIAWDHYAPAVSSNGSPKVMWRMIGA